MKKLCKTRLLDGIEVRTVNVMTTELLWQHIETEAWKEILEKYPKQKL